MLQASPRGGYLFLYHLETVLENPFGCLQGFQVLGHDSWVIQGIY